MNIVNVRKMTFGLEESVFRRSPGPWDQRHSDMVFKPNPVGAADGIESFGAVMASEAMIPQQRSPISVLG
jgi:hypothetical protein